MRLASTLLKYALGVGVLGGLFVVLFPCGCRDRESARRSSCQSNLKQIALCFRGYMMDYDERLPPVQTTADQGWVDLIQLYEISPTMRDMFQCPNNPNKRQNLTDYFYNAQLSEAKLKSIAVPTATILAGDGNYDAPLNTAIAALPQGWRDYKESPAYRHKEGANYAFVDGHVKWFKVEKVTLQSPKQADVYTFLSR